MTCSCQVSTNIYAAIFAFGVRQPYDGRTQRKMKKTREHFHLIIGRLLAGCTYVTCGVWCSASLAWPVVSPLPETFASLPLCLLFTLFSLVPSTSSFWFPRFLTSPLGLVVLLGSSTLLLEALGGAWRCSDAFRFSSSCCKNVSGSLAPVRLRI
jgi:hypothetical protein